MFCGGSSLRWPQVSISSQVLFAGLQQIRGFAMKLSGNSIVSSRSCNTLCAVRDWCTTGALPTSVSVIHSLLTGRETYKVQNAPAILLLILGRQHCTERRDRLFALLGMLNKIISSDKVLFNSRYASSTVDIYTEITRVILQQTNWFGFCCAFSAIKSEDPMSLLPSWVPHYDGSKENLNMLGLFRNTQFNAPGSYLSTESQPAQDIQFLDNQLGLTGCRVAVIKAGSEDLGEFDLCKTQFEAGLQLILDIGEIYHPTGQATLEAYWRTRVVDSFQNATPSEMMASFVHWWLHTWTARASNLTGEALDEYLRTMPNVDLVSHTISPGVLADREAIRATISPNVSERDGLNAILRKSAALFGTAMSYWVRNRRLFSTEEGHLGNAINTLRKGDEIWISPRARTPFILRRTQSATHPDRFLFIGECYVHGMMDGEQFIEQPPVWREVWLQ